MKHLIRFFSLISHKSGISSRLCSYFGTCPKSELQLHTGYHQPVLPQSRTTNYPQVILMVDYCASYLAEVTLVWNAHDHYCPDFLVSVPCTFSRVVYICISLSPVLPVVYLLTSPLSCMMNWMTVFDLKDHRRKLTN